MAPWSEKEQTPTLPLTTEWPALAQDPITLEPLSSLPVPPFELLPSNKGGLRGEAGRTRHLFDGHVLAEYIVSTGRFENPCTRAELSRDDCLRLDTHCREHATCGARTRDGTGASLSSVTEAYDVVHSMALAKGDGSESHARHARTMRREASLALMHLFQFRRASHQSASNRARGSAHSTQRPSARAAPDVGTVAKSFQLAPPMSRVAALGAETGSDLKASGDTAAGLVIIDDDEEGDRWRQTASAAGAVEDEFPELSVRALELAELRAASHGSQEMFLKIAEEFAQKKAREDQERAEQAHAVMQAKQVQLELEREAHARCTCKQGACKERAMRTRDAREAHARCRAQRVAEIAAHDSQAREAAVAAAAVREAEERAKQEEFEIAAAVQAVELAVREKEREKCAEAERQRQQQQKREQEMAAVRRKEEQEKAALEAEQARREREAEKRRLKREREKQKKAAQRQADAAAAAVAAAKAAQDEAIRNAPTKCKQCGIGVLAGKGFEVAGSLFCSTACVREFRKAPK